MENFKLNYMKKFFLFFVLFISKITFAQIQCGTKTLPINASRATLQDSIFKKLDTIANFRPTTVSNFPSSTTISNPYAVSAGDSAKYRKVISVDNFPSSTTERSADLSITATAAAGASVTLTLPAPAAGLFHYISRIEISCYTTLVRAGAVTPVIVTTTNLAGNPSWDFSTAAAVGTTERIFIDFTSPIKSSIAATATTLVSPASVSVIWKMKVFYYIN